MGYHQLPNKIIQSVLLFFRSRINDRVIEEDDVQIDSARPESDARHSSDELFDVLKQLKKLERL